GQRRQARGRVQTRSFRGLHAARARRGARRALVRREPPFERLVVPAERRRARADDLHPRHRADARAAGALSGSAGGRAAARRGPTDSREAAGARIVALMTRRISRRACAFVLAILVAFTLLASAGAGARPSRGGNVGWGGFGNTPDELRHSPLTQINAGNVDRLN